MATQVDNEFIFTVTGDEAGDAFSALEFDVASLSVDIDYFGAIIGQYSANEAEDTDSAQVFSTGELPSLPVFQAAVANVQVGTAEEQFVISVNGGPPSTDVDVPFPVRTLCVSIWFPSRRSRLASGKC